VVVEEEEDSVYTQQANNTTTNDNHNDIGKSNNEGDDEEGYESWTEGNWCLILPFPPAVVGNIEGPSTSARRRRVVRNRNSSRQQSHEEDRNKCNNEDYNVADNDDGGDVLSFQKSETRKGTILRYTEWQNERWNEKFHRLVAYKKKYKSINVPTRYESDPKLGIWVSNQRAYYRNKEISVERISRLDSIGFVWKIHDIVPWEEMFRRLVAYKNKHKSTNIPFRYEADPRLGQWVSTQRKCHSNKTLSIERINRLDSVGFVWAQDYPSWIEMYSKLVEYKKQSKSTQVPCPYTEDPPLGNWVHTQRTTYKNGKLSGKRLKLLNSINFAWSAKKAF
jgi:hypothetical protein